MNFEILEFKFEQIIRVVRSLVIEKRHEIYAFKRFGDVFITKSNFVTKLFLEKAAHRAGL